MVSAIFLILLLLEVPFSDAFATRPFVVKTQCTPVCHQRQRLVQLHLSEETNDDSAEESSSEQQQQQQQEKPLDPLIVSLTRMDPATQQAPTVSIPIWGELILDRSLFVFLPVALFALGGLLLSIQVAISSVDTIVDATLVPTTTRVVEDTGCRGLCSDQESSYTDMEVFMKRLAGK